MLGIEVSQYTDSTRTQQIIVPRFVGETEAARQTKRSRSGSSSRVIDRDELLSSFDASSEDRTAAVALLDWAAGQPDLELSWTDAANIDVPGPRRVRLLRLWRSGRWLTGELEVRLQSLKNVDRSTWDADGCDQLIRRLEASTDLHFDNDRRWPKAPIAPLADSHKRQSFLEIIEQVVRSLNPPA